MGPLLPLVLALGLAEADAAVRPPADLQLVGVVVPRGAGRSVAVLRSPGGRQRTVAVGESVFGGRVVSVAPNLAVLDFGGQRVELRLASRVAALPAPSSGPAPAPPPPSAEDGGTLTFERKEVQQRLGAEMQRILAETAVVPVLTDGRVTGMSISRMPQGSLLSDAGLQAGDVITQINDTPIDGMATLISLWPRLQNASDLQAMVLRNGSPVALRVKLR
jgi:general secretion pathway protein C